MSSQYEVRVQILDHGDPVVCNEANWLGKVFNTFEEAKNYVEHLQGCYDDNADLRGSFSP